MEGTADREQPNSALSEVPSEVVPESSEMGQLLSVLLNGGADDISKAKDNKGKSAQPVKGAMKLNDLVLLPSGLACVRARKCGHLMHPAYKYLEWSRCPPCEIQYQIEHLAGRQVEIAQWVAEQEQRNTEPKIKANDLLKAARHYYVDDDADAQYCRNNTKWGFRKALATSLLTTYENVVEMEEHWDERNKPTGPADERPWEGHTAADAIKLFEEARKHKAFSYVEETTANAAYRKALREQAELAGDNGELSSTPPTGPQMLLNLQKREVRPDVNVNWNPEVYVRADADIDTVRRSSSMKLNPHKTKTPLRSILRAKTDVPPLGPPCSPSVPEPVTSHEVIRLNDDTSDDWRQFRRSGPHHEAGPWTIDDGERTNVNTSFANFFPSHQNSTESYWDKMKTYVDELHEELQEEADENDEESGSDDKWEDAEEDASEEGTVEDHPTQEDGETRDLTSHLEKILDWEFDWERTDPITGEEGVLCYWVLWKGCTKPIWCPYYGLADCGRVLEEFLQKHPEIPLPGGDSDEEEEDSEEDSEEDTEEDTKKLEESDEDGVAQAEQQMLPSGNLETIEEEPEEEQGREPIAEL